jgi:hypothetical protein
MNHGKVEEPSSSRQDKMVGRNHFVIEELYGEIPVKYFESYISLSVGGLARVWVNRRSNNRVTVEVKVGQYNLQAVVDHLNAEGFSVRSRASWTTINFNVNLQQLRDKVETHKWLASRLSPENLKTDSHQSKSSG